MMWKDLVLNALKKEFDRRREKNPSYSMRAFARYLKIDSASLAQIISGKRNLSEKISRRFATQLGMNIQHVLFADGDINNILVVEGQEKHLWTISGTKSDVQSAISKVRSLMDEAAANSTADDECEERMVISLSILPSSVKSDTEK